ncbi:carboxylate--amine ligase [Halomicroarcula sp. S1AR25-4]|uniref:carboxylate--amine ligase n=1 Tax=Haloarcula sp. S1AR25-4 TaxID=2950538 RepID=UPI002874DF12|nr:carboxylate--amine ligase [Halomicroarcula sp. S1AR25-4]MDS0278228.1 carboxylate--amine ligase [Halomicroarcula sp. S1AR25-4]
MGVSTGHAAVVIANGSPGSIAAVLSLGRRGVDTIVASDLTAPPSARSRHCDEFVPLPEPTDPDDYAAALLSLARRPDVRTILPGREQDIFVLASHRDAFADHVTPFWPDFETVRETHDRLSLFATAAATDAPIPTTEPLDAVTDWSGERIVKSRYALLTDAYDRAIPSRDLHKPPSTVYLEPGQTPDRQALVERMEHVPVAQSYVGGTEYSFRALYDHGDPVLTSQIRQHRGYKYTGGASVYRESIFDPRLERSGRALLDALDWHGPAEVEFRRPADGDEYLLMEVNPRLWASLSCDIRAGVDYPWVLWRLAGDDPVPETTDYETGVGTHLLRGEVSYLYSLWTHDCPLVDPPSPSTAIRNLIASFRRHPDCDYFSPSDPWPFVRDVRLAIRSHLP